MPFTFQGKEYPYVGSVQQFYEKYGAFYRIIDDKIELETEDKIYRIGLGDKFSFSNKSDINKSTRWPVDLVENCLMAKNAQELLRRTLADQVNSNDIVVRTRNFCKTIEEFKQKYKTPFYISKDKTRCIYHSDISEDSKTYMEHTVTTTGMYCQVKIKNETPTQRPALITFDELHLIKSEFPEINIEKILNAYWLLTLQK